MVRNYETASDLQCMTHQPVEPANNLKYVDTISP